MLGKAVFLLNIS